MRPMKTVVVLCAEWGQLYPHTADLLALEFCRSADPWPSPQLSQVHTPLNPAAWETALASHPDRAFARYILKGIREGFRIGFSRTCPLRSAHRNMPSARLHPEVVQAYLGLEFQVLAPPDSRECAEALAIIRQACTRLGVPLAEHKQEGPTTCLTFLGIEVDTTASQLRLPGDKLRRLQALLEGWSNKRVCERRELESLAVYKHRGQPLSGRLIPQQSFLFPV